MALNTTNMPLLRHGLDNGTTAQLASHMDGQPTACGGCSSSRQSTGGALDAGSPAWNRLRGRPRSETGCCDAVLPPTPSPPARRAPGHRAGHPTSKLDLNEPFPCWRAEGGENGIPWWIRRKWTTTKRRGGGLRGPDMSFARRQPEAENQKM